MTEISQTITDYIVEYVTYGEAVSEDQSLIESGLIDSTSIFDMIAHLEAAFEITITDEDIDPDNFDSVKQMTAFVESKRVAA
jgi:acyl carrier protein